MNLWGVNTDRHMYCLEGVSHNYFTKDAGSPQFFFAVRFIFIEKIEVSMFTLSGTTMQIKSSRKRMQKERIALSLQKVNLRAK